MKLTREFYPRDGLTVARELIVETKAYMGAIDAAAHSYRGKTERTKIFYSAGGL